MSGIVALLASNGYWDNPYSSTYQDILERICGILIQQNDANQPPSYFFTVEPPP